MTLLTDQFFDSFASSIKSIEDADTLPAECYVEEEFHHFEKEAIFHHEWLCVGRAEWLENPGDFFTVTRADEPIVVCKTRDGTIKALSSVCQHRAMLVAEGHGNTRAFVCPYHHWTYDLDGTLVGAPAMNRTCNFDKKSASLPEIRHEIWHGFVFINLDPDAEPLTPRLAGLEEVVANYDFASLRGPRPDEPTVFPWNWKVMLENNNDGYHASRLHAGPLHDFIPSGLASFPEMPEGSAGYYRLNGTLHKNAAFNATQRAVFPVFPKLTEEEQNRLLFVNLPPSLSLVVLNDTVLYLIMDPRSAESHALTIGTLMLPEAMEDPLFELKVKMTDEAVERIVAQDFHVDELVQQGLRSKFAPRGRYSWQEGAQRLLNVWLVERYWAEWNRRRGPSAPVTAIRSGGAS
ncbi:aromatic ring-hydroxylating oxygenase subunit alpha [Novosphingobium beihaiensis]|uniref:Aromatic ring-hydroxylating dioxygenase subunit alpha n=1 Tax=Novosphingobium beihaiensis TaxID=2930389 RepID=A0ABT0BM65_9SPHN|nr:aromatic ring-hydroxylating dioxygenase subunit alpha [Novosphingobium beihaiensis]MCJ2185943.1 aromatic ring-hydroxylating dioxygenase subunit alpha [Novosphingobium beihaiensis]